MVWLGIIFCWIIKSTIKYNAHTKFVNPKMIHYKPSKSLIMSKGKPLWAIMIQVEATWQPDNQGGRPLVKGGLLMGRQLGNE